MFQEFEGIIPSGDRILGEHQKQEDRKGSDASMPVPRSTVIKQCRVCRAQRFAKVLSLGDQYVSDFVTSEGTHTKAPLELVRCVSCGLVQLRHTFPRASLYRHYWYRSGISGTMKAALADIAAKACNISKPNRGEIVMDIGC